MQEYKLLAVGGARQLRRRNPQREVIELDGDEASAFETALNEYAELGWRLVTTLQPERQGVWYFLMEREKKDKGVSP